MQILSETASFFFLCFNNSMHYFSIYFFSVSDILVSDNNILYIVFIIF